jgi:lipase maturation factor 1
MRIGGIHFLSKLAPYYGPHYGVGAQGCLRGLGLIYVISFWSLAAQVVPLCGPGGLLPSGLLMDITRQQQGEWAPLFMPSLLWLSQQPLMLLGLTGLGTLAGLGLLYGFFPWFCGVLSWICWVSLLQFCQPWLSTPGDALTAEVGLLALLLVPPFSRRYPNPSRMGSRITGILLLNGLLFKVLFSSGLAKLTLGDPSWADSTAFYRFFETTPLPTAITWHAHFLPETLLKYGVWGMVFIELILAFYVFLPRTFRNILAGAVGVESFLLLLTGHYGFLPLLLILLAFTLVDDVSWRRLLPDTWGPTASISLWQPGLFSVLLLVLMLPLMIWQTYLKNEDSLLPPWKQTGMVLGHLRSSNRYALFTQIPEQRREISIQGSMDGRQWVEYRFKLKPTDPQTLPHMAMLHLPRLDEQFARLAAAIDPEKPANPPLWLFRLVNGLMQNDPAILSLFPVNPFPDAPPQYIRLAVYDYHFADPVTRREEKVWWQREFKSFYGPVFSRSAASPE